MHTACFTQGLWTNEIAIVTRFGMVNMKLAPGRSMKIINTYKSGTRHSYRPRPGKGKKKEEETTLPYTPLCKHDNGRDLCHSRYSISPGRLRLRRVSLPTMHTVGKRRSLFSMTIGQSFNAGDLDFTLRANKGNCPGR